MKGIYILFHLHERPVYIDGLLVVPVRGPKSIFLHLLSFSVEVSPLLFALVLVLSSVHICMSAFMEGHSVKWFSVFLSILSLSCILTDVSYLMLLHAPGLS